MGSRRGSSKRKSTSNPFRLWAPLSVVIFGVLWLGYGYMKDHEKVILCTHNTSCRVTTDRDLTHGNDDTQCLVVRSTNETFCGGEYKTYRQKELLVKLETECKKLGGKEMAQIDNHTFQCFTGKGDEGFKHDLLLK